MERKYVVRLTLKERKKLLGIVGKGQNKALVIRRAHILLKSDEGRSDEHIAELVYCDADTVRNIRKRFCEDGLDGALEDKAHPAPVGRLDSRQEAYLIALTCSTPPAGQARWTLKLLAERLVSDGIVASISPETVRLVLEKTT
jgi:transposase